MVVSPRVYGGSQRRNLIDSLRHRQRPAAPACVHAAGGRAGVDRRVHGHGRARRGARGCCSPRWSIGTHLAVALPGQFFPHYHQYWFVPLSIGAGWGARGLWRLERPRTAPPRRVAVALVVRSWSSSRSSPGCRSAAASAPTEVRRLLHVLQRRLPRRRRPAPAERDVLRLDGRGVRLRPRPSPASRRGPLEAPDDARPARRVDHAAHARGPRAQPARAVHPLRPPVGVRRPPDHQMVARALRPTAGRESKALPALLLRPPRRRAGAAAARREATRHVNHLGPSPTP